MTLVLFERQVLLYAHLIAFALAIAEIIKGDWRLLRDRDVDLQALARTARVVTMGLVGLWITGLGLVWLETGFDPVAIASRPKLVAKLMVVAALTANGGLLHTFAFPRLGRPDRRPRQTARMASALGAVSTVSWLYAGFLGVGRIIAPAMSLEIFVGLYVCALCAGMATALGIVAPMVEVRLLRNALQDLMPQLVNPRSTDAHQSRVAVPETTESVTGSAPEPLAVGDGGRTPSPLGKLARSDRLTA